MINKRLINTGEAVVPFDPIQNFETVTYTGNGGTQKITGYIRKGAAFNGSSSYITTPLNISNIVSNINDRTQDFTFSCWFNTSSSTGQNILYLGNYTTYAPNYHWIGLGLTSNQVKFEAYDGTAYNVSQTVSLNTWYNVVGVRESGVLKLYVNGSFIGQTTQAGNTSISSSSTLRIGTNISNAEKFNGKIDQVRIFDKALSSSEVTTLYGETYASSTKSTTDIFGDGSGVALYELDDDANDTGSYPYGTGAIDSGQSAVFNNNNPSRSVVDVNISLGSVKTISHWIKFNEFQVDNIHIFSSSSNNLNLILGNLSGSRDFGFYDGVSVKLFGSSFPNDFNWHHLVWVLNGTSTSLYLDGSFVSTITTASTTQADIVIGSNSAFSGVRGSIDQLRIYSSALSASDVEALASETNVPTANLVAHYKLDGNANDETGSYNGTATSITYSDPAEFPLVTYNGTPTNVNFLGMAFQPDFVWTKPRSYADNHQLWDSVRGAGWTVYSNSTNAENPTIRLDGVSSFDSNGFTIGSWNNINVNGSTYVAWCWKAGGAAVTNTDGDNNSLVSANVDAGFSIVKTLSNNTNQTYGHGLNSAPDMIISKNMDVSGPWGVYHSSLGTGKWLYLNQTDAVGSSINVYPTVNNLAFSGGSGGWNNLTYNYIHYCFHSVDGYQKVGSYTGTGASGNVIITGFRPRFVMMKKTNATSNWYIHDSLRNGTGSGNDGILFPNLSNAEDASYNYIDFNSNNFTLNFDDLDYNTLNGEYIYLAIA